jgi:hypothetical protein
MQAITELMRYAAATWGRTVRVCVMLAVGALAVAFVAAVLVTNMALPPASGP